MQWDSRIIRVPAKKCSVTLKTWWKYNKTAAKILSAVILYILEFWVKTFMMIHSLFHRSSITLNANLNNSLNQAAVTDVSRILIFISQRTRLSPNFLLASYRINPFRKVNWHEFGRDDHPRGHCWRSHCVLLCSAGLVKVMAAADKILICVWELITRGVNS